MKKSRSAFLLAESLIAFSLIVINCLMLGETLMTCHQKIQTKHQQVNELAATKMAVQKYQVHPSKKIKITLDSADYLVQQSVHKIQTTNQKTGDQHAITFKYQ